MRKIRKRGWLTGFTLMEVILATVIMSLTLTALAGVIVAAKKWVFHARNSDAGDKISAYVLKSLSNYVRQSDWDVAAGDYVVGNGLQKGTRTGTSQTIDGITYTPEITADIPPGLSADSPVRRVKATIRWNE